MRVSMHRFILHNDEIRGASEKLLSPGQVGLLSGWGVFSTMRVCDGVIFAFERHWARMKQDSALLGVPFPSDAGAVRNRLLELVRANQAENSTLRLVVVRNRGGTWEGPGVTRDYDLIGLTAEVKEWGREVRLTLGPQARYSTSKFTGAKILSWSHNLAWLEEAQSKGFDEVILLNERGQVSECTSANIFISEGKLVWTPPLSSGCLPGITRELLLKEIHVPGIQVGEKELEPADLEGADEVFIASTTRTLLPVVYVEGLKVRQAGVARVALQRAFSTYFDAYIAHQKEIPSPTVRV